LIAGISTWDWLQCKKFFRVAALKPTVTSAASVKQIPASMKKLGSETKKVADHMLSKSYLLSPIRGDQDYCTIHPNANFL